MSARTAVVLGGGIGGVVAARRLRRRLASDDRVVLIERDPLFRFAPSYLWVMHGDRRPAQITRDLRHLRANGIEVIEAEITGIDPAEHRVTTSVATITGDALVVALGAHLDPAALSGFAEIAHNIYTIDGAQAAGDAVRSISTGAVAILVASTPYKCPAAPYEAAFLADDLLRRSGVRDRVTVDVYTPESLPMPTAGPAIGDAVVELLAARGIGFHPGRSVTRIDAGTNTLGFADGGDAHTDVLLGVPPHRPPDVVATSALASDSSYIPVDRHTLATSVPDVFAIGDVTAIPIAGGKLLPKAGVFAETEALVVADRIAHEWRGRTSHRVFDGKGSCFLEIGGGHSAYAGGDFYAPDGPNVAMRGPGRRWHLAKVAFEHYWMRRWL
jgi:sulfide:quinone oxidoreductase